MMHSFELSYAPLFEDPSWKDLTRALSGYSGLTPRIASMHFARLLVLIGRSKSRKSQRDLPRSFRIIFGDCRRGKRGLIGPGMLGV